MERCHEVGNRRFTAEFRIGIAKRIVNGESVSAIYHEQQIKRSVLYRWRDAYVKEGEAGLLHAKPGPKPGGERLVKQAAAAAQAIPESGPGQEAEALQKALARTAELERVVGRQTLQIDFLAGAFKRVKESSRKKSASGKTASTERSGQ
jgi:transposase-like protein